jgi:hypothetical protein
VCRFNRQHKGQTVKLLIQMHGDTGFDVDSHRKVRMPRSYHIGHTTFGMRHLTGVAAEG